MTIYRMYRVHAGVAAVVTAAGAAMVMAMAILPSMEEGLVALAFHVWALWASVVSAVSAASDALAVSAGRRPKKSLFVKVMFACLDNGSPGMHPFFTSDLSHMGMEAALWITSANSNIIILLNSSSFMLMI